MAKRLDKWCSAAAAWIFPAVIPASLAAHMGTIAGPAAAYRPAARRAHGVEAKRRSCFRGDGAFCSSGHRKIDEIDPRGLVGTSEALEAVLELGMG